ncbi:hypothetical protein PHJA_002772600 [Phtheirospermum japonicum]|uniref:Uncharacterized protein n=1 Tax=Phtheirospermum japonicum TaxID=374723 RepID=A0A830DHP7_9LAMI|nr:hypothetical protein PHJA_002772600 [Phtheirospermum japonicum]
MDGPMNSSVRNKDNINIHVTEDDYDHVSEESGWTSILEDFSCSNNGSFMSSPSLVSDAAWYGPDNNISHVKRLSFKNLKRSNNNRKHSCDGDLEDTASSPVNSPKISTLKQMEVNYPRIDDVAAAGNFLGKRAGSTSFSELIETEEKNGKNVDLRKRGLCVVPMSAFINYFG